MSKKKPFTMALEGELGLRDADAVAARLREAVASHPAIAIDAGNLKEIDISIIQLLIAAQKSAAALGHAFTIASPKGGAFRQALVRGGVLDPREGCRSPADAFWLGGAAAGGAAS